MATVPQPDIYGLAAGSAWVYGGRAADASPPPPPPSNSFASAAITSATGGPTTPFAFGQVFCQGDLPVGSYLAGLQVDVKTTWSDGSAQWGVVSGTAPLLAGQAGTVGLALGAPLSGAAITTAALAALTASVTTDAYGSATWSGTDWNTPVETWASGPAMSSWVYRKQIGTDAHLVACLEVRAWATGDIDVLPYVENGYLRVAAPGQRSATYTFTLAGTARFSALIDLLNHQRTPLLDGVLLSHWVGADKAFNVKHDSAYMQSTELVPTYAAVISPTSGLVTGAPTTFTPLQLGRYEAYMPGTGYSPSIGLLPQWDVLHLTSTASSTWELVQRQGYSAGRFGFHFRDETTGKPLSFASYPNLQLADGSGIGANAGPSGGATLTPAPTGGVPDTWDLPHHPATGYFAALITGRPYHVETAQFVATIHYLKNSVLNRQGSSGLLLTGAGAVTLRGAAWSLRSLAMAGMVTPDNSPLKAQFFNSLGANAAYYHATYVAQPNNPLGLVHPYKDYNITDSIYTSAAWQHDFFVSAWGLILAMRPAISPTNWVKAQQFFNYISFGIVGRLGRPDVPTEWPYFDANTYYETAFAPSATPDWVSGAGPWYANWGEAYVASYTSAGAAPVANPTGALRGGYFPEGQSFWGNMHPAIAYAARHGAPGAETAWNRLTAAINYSSLSWVNGPESSVIPAKKRPSWLTSHAVNEWFPVPNSQLTLWSGWEAMPGSGFWGDRNMFVRAENGAALNEDTSEFWMFGGGHADYYGNELLSFSLDTETPGWNLRCARSTTANVKLYGSGGSDWTWNLDGKPASRHTYQGTHFIRKLNRYMAFDGFTWPAATGRPIVPATFDPVAGTWDGQATWTMPTPIPYNAGPGAFAKHPITEDMYWMPGNGYSMWKLDTTTKVWSVITGDIGSGLARFPVTECAAIDPKRNALTYLTTRGSASANAPRLTQINLTTGARTELSIAASAAWTDFQTKYTDHSSGLTYVSDGDYFLFYFGGTGTAGRIWKLTPNATTTWDLAELVMTGTVAESFGVALGNVLTRFRHVPALNAVVVLPLATSPMYMARLA